MLRVWLLDDVDQGLGFVFCDVAKLSRETFSPLWQRSVLLCVGHSPPGQFPPFLHGVEHVPLPPPPSANLHYKAIYRVPTRLINRPTVVYIIVIYKQPCALHISWYTVHHPSGGCSLCLVRYNNQGVNIPSIRGGYINPWAHPSTASVPTSYYSMSHNNYYRCPLKYECGLWVGDTMAMFYVH